MRCGKKKRLQCIKKCRKMLFSRKKTRHKY